MKIPSGLSGRVSIITEMPLKGPGCSGLYQLKRAWFNVNKTGGN